MEAEILQHKISYYYENSQEMPESEREHIKEMIIKGYCEGELYCQDSEKETRGYWKKGGDKLQHCKCIYTVNCEIRRGFS